jgi:hypothetical protein
MKRKFKIVPRWEPEKRFTLPLRRQAPLARRLPEWLPESFYCLEEEVWETSAPLQ